MSFLIKIFVIAVIFGGGFLLLTNGENNFLTGFSVNIGENNETQPSNNSFPASFFEDKLGLNTTQSYVISLIVFLVIFMIISKFLTGLAKIVLILLLLVFGFLLIG